MLKALYTARNAKGFTLMEMLIVVAIIAILVAIAIPVFSSQLEKAREATDAANIRAAYAQAMANFIDGKVGADGQVTTQAMVQTEAGFKYITSSIGTLTAPSDAVAGKTYVISVAADGTASIN